MRKQLLSGTACAALCLISFSGAARSATLDDVMARLDKIERENAELRHKVRELSATKPGAAAPVATDPSKFNGNPVLHAGVATSPTPPPPVPGMPVKAGPWGPIVDNTVVTLYGHFDLSADLFNSGVFDQGTKAGIASNSSYFGVRARHNLAPYGWEGWSIVAQLEAQIDAAASPTERAAIGSRDSYVGLEGPWGAVKAGKSDTPYKKSTAAMDPFASSLGDYNSIMGNAYSAALNYKNGPWTAIAAYELHEGVNRRGDDNTQFDAQNFAPGAILLPDGSTVMTGVHNEWAAKVGGGYRFNDGLGDLQLNAYYEWIRREVTAIEQPFNERSRDGVFASATQFIGKWSVSASYAHAFKTPGNPTCLSLNNVNAGIACVSPGPITQIGQFQANAFDDSASQYALGARYRFNQWASWYVVGSVLKQGPGAHYCLGASGHGYQVCSRDAANDTIGGATLKAATTGLTFDF